MNGPRFNSWKEGAILYGPWIVIGLLCLVVRDSAFMTAVGTIAFLSGAFILFFFRDPPRRIPEGDEIFVAPADGKVVAIEDLDVTPHYDGPCRRISIFLSLFDVHINRAPCDGTVTHITYRPGEFRNAMQAETTECNESTTIFLETPHGPVTVRQIAGLVARRIVWRMTPGDWLTKGQKFGMIKFSSRTELYVPVEASVCIQTGSKVYAGTTIVARMTEQEANGHQETPVSA